MSAEPAIEATDPSPDRAGTAADIGWALDPGLVARLASHVVAGPDAELVLQRTPMTGGPIGSVPRSRLEDVARAAVAARKAQPQWAARAMRDRVAVLRRLYDGVLARQAEGLDLIQLETGKSRIHAFEEIADVAINASWYARKGPSIIASRQRQGLLPVLTSVTEIRHPKGVIGMITPWNYPLVLTLSDAIPALLAGNAVLLKPDGQTPMTALWAADLLAQAGLPAGLFGVLHGPGPVIGRAIIECCDHICFTGSTDTGRKVAGLAADRLIGASLELGGKNPVYVADDADLAAAAEGVVRDAFGNTGHACVSMERLILHERIADAFLDAFLDRVRRLRLGPQLDYSADLGSIASRKQFDLLRQHVADAVAKGARVLAGGHPRPDLGPLFHEPTVLADVPETAMCYAAETFGPLVAVYRVASDAEAIRLANNTRYGLNASVWSGNQRRARRIARRIQVGTVTVNEAYIVGWGSVAGPMGGWKDSGIGRRHGADGILRFTEPQSVVVQRSRLVARAAGLGGSGYSRVFTGSLRLSRRLRYPWP